MQSGGREVARREEAPRAVIRRQEEEAVQTIWRLGSGSSTIGRCRREEGQDVSKEKRILREKKGWISGCWGTVEKATYSGTLEKVNLLSG